MTTVQALSPPSVLEASSWKPRDLGPFLRGEVTRPEPSIGLARTDGLQMLYPGKEHFVIGEMESGKSWFSLACVAAELIAGRDVLYVHFEEADPIDTVERLLLLDVPADRISRHLDFVAPESPITDAVRDILLTPPPSLVVLDGVNEAMSLHQQEIMGPDGAATFRRKLVKPFTAVGAAVLACDHVVKDPEKRGRGPLGSVHKGNGLSGSLIVLENAEPFGRGVRGCSHVFVTKDRPGHLRSRGRATKLPGKTYMGSLVVDDSQLYGPDFTLRFYAPSSEAAADAEAERPTVDTDLDDKVIDAVKQIGAGGQTPSLRKVRAAVKGRVTDIDRTLDRLTLPGGPLVETRGPRNTRVFTVSQDQKAA